MEEKRSYEGDGITISFEAKICAHAAECVKGLPSVFNTDARPWINATGASIDEIKEVIGRCPSGALTYELHDAADASGSAVEIKVMNDGPLVLSGAVEVQTADGTLIRAGDKLALCRCGASANKPFCDGTHKEIGFSHSP